jgi:gamma-glutamylcyclotransferase (GGCT)/AIG2-like uncharacterized protein YtfP
VSDSNREHLFVYGTLRRGAGMHALLDGSARRVGPARYRGRLYHLGGFPGAVASHDPNDVIHGELYGLARDDARALLERLDHYEGAEFERVRAEVGAEGDRMIESWLYLYRASVSGRRRIVSGDFLAEPSLTISQRAGPRGRRLMRAT